MRRVAFIDDQLLCRDFRTDDVVRKSSLRDYVLTPYSGRVLFSNPRTGKVAVQWPWGVESESPAELVKVIADHFAPVSHEDGVSTHEGAVHKKNEDTKKANSEWRKGFASELARELKNEFEAQNKTVYHAACKALHDDMPEVKARELLVHKFAASHGFDTVNSITGDVYGQGYRLAIYWAAAMRKYKRTRNEVASKRYSCPRCRTGMSPLRFRFRQDLHQCGACGFAIDKTDLM